MLQSITSLIRGILGQDHGTASQSRFWALVVQAEGDGALLESHSGKFAAKLEVPVQVGERLLLERRSGKAETVQCKILRRLPPGEGMTQQADSYLLYWHSKEGRRVPYFLTVSAEDGSPASEGERMWRFTIHTEHLGAVAVLVKEQGKTFVYSILAETEEAASRLAAGNLQGPITGIRVKRFAEKQSSLDTGCFVNRLR